MVIALEEVVFDHKKGSATTDALSIRKNRTMDAPPWTAATNGAGLPSLAAYAIKPTRHQTITIQASFSMTAVAGGPIKVRARAAAGSSKVLGNVAATQIAVPSSGNLTGPISLTLTATNIGTLGVGRHAVEWRWQHQVVAGGAWVDFDTSRHTVYTVLDVPTLPWAQDAADSEDRPWPWTDVLDWACCWAEGIRASTTAVSKRVTERIHRLGGQPARRPDGSLEPITYDGFETYVVDAGNVFLCTAF